MTAAAAPAAQTTPTRTECIADAGEIYGAILADPERAAQLTEARAAHKTTAPVRGTPPTE